MKTLMMSLAMILSLLSANVFSEESAKRNVPTKEQREAMAVGHEKMAACLRSDKSIDSCHDEMRAECDKVGPENCPGMGMGMGMGMGKGMGKGMGRRGGMKKGMMSPSSNQPEKK